MAYDQIEQNLGQLPHKKYQDRRLLPYIWDGEEGCIHSIEGRVHQPVDFRRQHNRLGKSWFGNEWYKCDQVSTSKKTLRHHKAWDNPMFATSPGQLRYVVLSTR